jgi:hypothetical protein
MRPGQKTPSSFRASSGVDPIECQALPTLGKFGVFPHIDKIEKSELNRSWFVDGCLLLSSAAN